MSNTFKTLSDGDIMNIMLDSFHNKSVFLQTINRQHEKDFAVERHKNGGSILIKNPNEFIIGTGAVISVQPITETTQTMTVATQKNVPVTITSYERTMSLTDFQQEVADPAMSRLVSEVEYDVLKGAYPYVWNLTGASTMATEPATLACITNASARLTQCLAPEDDRHLLLDPIAMAGVTGGVASYFHKSDQVSMGFAKGYMGEASGFKWRQSAMVPAHTNGTRTDTTPVCNTSTGITSGSDTIVMTAFGDGLAYAVGDVFTIGNAGHGVYAVNRETKQTYSHLQQFTVKAVATETGTGDMSVTVYPTPVTSGAKQNVAIVGTAAGNLVLNLTGGGSGAASTAYTQNLAYHKDWLTFATAPLPLPHGDVARQATFENITMRMWQFSDGINDTHTTRFDVLYGYLVQRPDWCVRVRG